jgi:hypothetical protein
MGQETWELLRDHDFSEKQWRSILKPLGHVRVTAEDREEIVVAEIIYFTKRFEENSYKRFEWITRPAQKAKRLRAIYQAAWKLRTAMANAHFGYDVFQLSPPNSDDRFARTPTFSWSERSWNELIAKVQTLETSAKRKAEFWASAKVPPANVDQARDEAWGRLAEVYIRLTGKKPAASPRISRNDNPARYANGYGAFVEAFMVALGAEPPGDDEIPNFLRSRQFRERMKKFVDAHPGLLREHQLKKPLKRS